MSPDGPIATHRVNLVGRSYYEAGSLGRSTGRSVLPIAYLVASCILAAATYYNFKAVGEMRELEAELRRLPEFENRISDRLFDFNRGMQSIGEATNNRLAVLQSQLDDLAEKGSRSSAVLQAPSAGGDTSFFIPERNQFRPLKPQADAAAAPRQVPSEGSSQIVGVDVRFRRIVGADGSVRYERLR